MAIPVVLLLNSALLLLFDLDSTYWDEWGLYMMHVPLSIGLYLILFSKERDEDEFFLNLRLRSIARGVVMIVTAMVLLPFYSNVFRLFTNADVALPDVGGNMAVCTLLLAYANAAYFYNKSATAQDD